MYERKIAEDLDCGIVITMKVLGAKWKPCILDALSRGIHRPSALHRSIPSATPRVIDMQLSELEALGVVAKKAGTGFPLRTDYELTDLGMSIVPVIQQMDEWGLRHKNAVKARLERREHPEVHTFSGAPCNVSL